MALGLVIGTEAGPDPDLSAAAEVVVEEGMMAPTRYSVVYSADIEGDDLPLLTDDRLGPDAKLSVTVAGPDEAVCLVSGPVHGQFIRLVHSGEGSSVEVRGADRSVEMDAETKATVFADGADSDAVTMILAGAGFVPDVEVTGGRHVEAKHALVQRATDLAFVTQLARRNGASFWVRCDAAGVETAYFKRPATDQDPAATLTINSEPPSVTEVLIEWDTAAPSAAVVGGLDPATKAVLTGDVTASPLTPLGSDDLAGLQPTQRSMHFAPAADDAGDLTARAEGALIEAGWFVRATCKTSVAACGAVIRPHQVVALSGAGARFSGNWYVGAVTHRIDAEAHRMDLTLLRNAWGSDGLSII